MVWIINTESLDKKSTENDVHHYLDSLLVKWAMKNKPVYEVLNPWYMNVRFDERWGSLAPNGTNTGLAQPKCIGI